MTEVEKMDPFEGLSVENGSWESFISDVGTDIATVRGPTLIDDDDNSQRLPRIDFSLYGTHPKIDGREYCKCKICNTVYNPRYVKLHTCPVKSKEKSTQSKKKVTRKKKRQSSPVPPVPIFQDKLQSSPSAPISTELPIIQEIEKTSPSPLMIESFDVEPVITSTVPAQIIASTSPESPITVKAEITTELTSTASTSEEVPLDSSSNITASSISATASSSRHKKARKNKIPKEYNADIHCGVIDSKGICMRSITCSNHRIQQRKLVTGRSKDIHQLIAERKAAKEKDTARQTTEEKEIFRQNTSYVPLLINPNANNNNNDKDTKKTTYIPILPKLENNTIALTTPVSTTSIATTGLLMNTPNDTIFVDTSKSIDDGYHSTNSQEVNHGTGTLPVVYMPMSPVSVVSPVQLVQVGKNMVCIESPQPALSPPLSSTNQSLIWKIPDQMPNVNVYKSHPKPAALPTFGAKKLGGAILLSNQRIESQFTDIQNAIITRRKASNTISNYKTVPMINNSPHRPNILKIKSKVNCKRLSVDKISTSDSKQLRLTPDVNGFILHSDMSEGAEAPQANNSIQEKIALLNMK